MKKRRKKRQWPWPFYSHRITLGGGQFGMSYGSCGAQVFRHAFSITYATGFQTPKALFRINNAKALWIFPDYPEKSLTDVKRIIEQANPKSMATLKRALIDRGQFHLDKETRERIQQALPRDLGIENTSFWSEHKGEIQKQSEKEPVSDTGITANAILCSELIDWLEEKLTEYFRPADIITNFLTRR